MAQRPYSRALAVGVIAAASALSVAPATADVSVASASGDDVCKTTDVGQLCLAPAEGGYTARFSAFAATDNAVDFTLWTDHGPVQSRGPFAVTPHSGHSSFFVGRGEGSAHLCLHSRGNHFPTICTPELLSRAARLAVLSSVLSAIFS